MSQRPHLSLLCGITDLQVDNLKIIDPRYKSTNSLPLYDFLETYPPIPQKDDKGEWLDIRLGLEDLQDGTRDNLASNKYQVKDGFELIEFDPEFGVNSAIGYIIEDSGCRLILYALASIFPEVQTPSVIVLESMSLSMDVSADARYLKRYLTENKVTFDLGYDSLKEIEQKDQLSHSTNLMLRKATQIKNEQNYQFFDLTFLSYAICAEYLFKWIGLNVSRENMRLFLYYKWS